MAGAVFKQQETAACTGLWLLKDGHQGVVLTYDVWNKWKHLLQLDKAVEMLALV